MHASGGGRQENFVSQYCSVAAGSLAALCGLGCGWDRQVSDGWTGGYAAAAAATGARSVARARGSPGARYILGLVRCWPILAALIPIFYIRLDIVRHQSTPCILWYTFVDSYIQHQSTTLQLLLYFACLRTHLSVPAHSLFVRFIPALRVSTLGS